VRVRALDDELKPDTAVANVRRLLDTEGVFGFFGNVGSATTAATGPLLKQLGVPSIAGYAVADSAREKAKGAAYFVRASFGREAEALVQHLDTIGIKRIGLAVLDNPGGQETQGILTAALAKAGDKPAASVAVKGDGSNGALPGELMKAYWALGKSTSFYGMSIVAGEVTAKVAGERARGLAISQVVPYPWAQVDPLITNYRQMAEQAKVPVGYYSFEGYLNGMVLLEGLRRAGRDLTRPKLHFAMQGLKMRLAGMNIDFGGGALTGSRFIELVQVTQDGKFIR
jgi:ABC-type branched-subunit amino acid transport system substrate-binding protein